MVSIGEKICSNCRKRLELIEVSKFKKYRAQKEGSYVLKKMQKIQDGFSQKIDIVCGPSIQWDMKEEDALSNDESHTMQEVLTSLIQKY